MPDTPGPSAPLAESFHHHDPELVADPWPTYDRLRRECPVARSARYGGFWILSRYDDILAAARDPGTFSSAHGVAIPPLAIDRPLLPFETDPPRHTALRRLLMKRFSPPAVAALEPFATREADRLLDACGAAGRCDLVNDYALPLTAAVFGQLLALPAGDRVTLAHWTNRIMERISDPDGAATAIRDLLAYLDRLIATRQAGEPGDDLLGLLLSSEIGGERLDREDLLALCFTLVLAGLETTIISMGATMLYLAQHPELRARFLEDDERVKTVVEEFLRIEPPAAAHARTLTRDVEIHGRQLRAGERVLLLWASANRDPEQFPDPDAFVADRRPNRHFTFGAGPHRCIGADLARMEIRVAVRQLLVRYPGWSVDDESRIERFKPARGPRTLPAILA